MSIQVSTQHPSRFPRSFHIVAKPVGSLCNLDCTYCYYLHKEELLPDRASRIADDLLEEFVRQYIAGQEIDEVVFNWHGGEPALLGLDFYRKVTHYFFNGSTGALIDTNSNGIPDVAEAAPPSPNSSDNYIVALTGYDTAGRAYRSTDNLGRISETQYDDAGRVVKTIQNYANGTVAETDTDQDVTIAYEYDSGGRLVTMIAYNPKGSGNGVQSQATKYLYTSAVNASWQTAAVYPDSDDVLSQNETTKVWTITTDNGDHVSTSYDPLGRTTGTTDQRGVVREFTFDAAGRLSADTATGNRK